LGRNWHVTASLLAALAQHLPRLHTLILDALDPAWTLAALAAAAGGGLSRLQRLIVDGVSEARLSEAADDRAALVAMAAARGAERRPLKVTHPRYSLPEPAAPAVLERYDELVASAGRGVVRFGGRDPHQWD
jgi:hypothetical protein